MAEVTVWRVRNGVGEQVQDCLLDEAALSLEWNGTHHRVMMVTPGDLEDFALGYCLSEAVIDHPDELLSLEIVPASGHWAALMQIPDARLAALIARGQAAPGGSSCGLCGAADLESIKRMPRVHRPSDAALRPEVICAAMQQLAPLQVLGQATGAAHAAAFATATGEIVLLREDAGRHNALDKVIGAMANARLNPAEGVLLLTSRASFEMIQKAATAGFHTVAAISAATSMAQLAAEAAGMTLCTFVRGSGLNCVAGAAGLGGYPIDEEYR
ncbi:formate dehydrogenase accessory sulfurtransferase FdhD [Burkholderiaceae bacterium DAT-1]|nr:formate dehydrogenase accessory sulfurtransferase FdhD [Burkholderiaceae bacterium DAT-1]